MGGTPWLRIVRLALIGTVVMVLGVFADVEADGGNTVGLVQPATDGPAADVFQEDFPDLVLPGGIGHDGQQFYVIARSPTDLDGLTENLDRPRYRLQRPLFPLLAWALHPGGGGYGLVAALVVVGAASVFLAGIAAGALSRRLGGGAWPALLIPLLPGTYAALRLTLADTLALGLVLGSLYASERGRPAGAVVAGVLAVLAKESILVVLIGHALFRRTRASIAAAVAAGGAVALWWLVLRFVVDATSSQVLEFTWPFGGVVRSIDDWLGGDDLVAAAAVVITYLLAAAALWFRSVRHPLFGALLAVSAFSVFLGPDVVGLDFNGPRTLGPVTVLAILTLGTPDRLGEPTDAAVRSVQEVG
jgi:hypothetical protein